VRRLPQVVLLLSATTIVFALVPWAAVLPPALRLLGLALFGPHMYACEARTEGMPTAAALLRAVADAAPLLMPRRCALHGRYVVGVVRQRRHAETERRESEFRNASEEGRARILAGHRAEMTEEERARALKLSSKMLATRREHFSYLRSAKLQVVARETMRTSSRLRHRTTPDPYRSRAYPLQTEQRLSDTTRAR
jgi:hypothetical protein